MPSPLTVRDHVATGLVVVILVPYLAHLAWDGLPVLGQPRNLAALGLALGFSAFVIIRGDDVLDRTGLAEVSLAVVSLLLGLVALVLAETAVAEELLTAFMLSIVVAWSVEILDHAGILPDNHVGST